MLVLFLPPGGELTGSTEYGCSVTRLTSAASKTWWTGWFSPEINAPYHRLEPPVQPRPPRRMKATAVSMRTDAMAQSLQSLLLGPELLPCRSDVLWILSLEPVYRRTFASRRLAMRAVFLSRHEWLTEDRTCLCTGLEFG